MKIIADYGILYKMSDANYKKFIKASHKAGHTLPVDDFGAKCIGAIDADITSWSSSDIETHKDILK